MTAVAPPPNFQPISRAGWSAPNGAPNGMNSMSADEVSRMFMPRKAAQRTTSSSSIASSASSNSTVSASSVQTNGAPVDGFARKKPARSLWPPSKAEPTAGLSTARPQSVASSTSGPSAASGLSALHTPSTMLPSQNGVQSQNQLNGAPRPQGQPESAAILHLLPMNGTFERKTISVPFYPDVLRIGRQTNNKTIPTPTNGYFDSKVLSRQHAEVWADRNGKIWIRDVKSSNGTFVNGQRLSQENRDSDPHELREQDMLELGIDIVSEDQKTVVHHKVAARVEHAGIYTNGNNMMDMNFGDLDPSANGGMMNAPMGQNMGQLRARNGSQGSMVSNGRLGGGMGGMVNNVGALGQTPGMLIRPWLQTITVEQVVKKLNSEIRSAKQQSVDLQRAGQYVDSLLAGELKKEGAKLSNVPQSKLSPVKGDLKARFSDPPAPPPQQPLPEKPDAARITAESVLPLLRRSDTAKPKLPMADSSPLRSDQGLQVTSLVEALTSAKKELESQNGRLKDLEELLAQERQARESAEERAQRLEMESKKDLVALDDTAPNEDLESTRQIVSGDASSDTAAVDASTSRLQKRLELLVAELGEVKEQLEKERFSRRNAEAERDAVQETLAEMVEKLRQKQDEQTSRASSRSPRRHSSPGEKVAPSSPDRAPVASGDMEKKREEEEQCLSTAAMLRKVGIEQNGRPVTPEQVRELEQAMSQALATKFGKGDQLVHLSPFAAALAVILTGIGLMSYLNGLPKIER